MDAFQVIGLAVKESEGGAMREVVSLDAAARGSVSVAGLAPVESSEDRGITLISGPQWQQVQADLAVDGDAALPWHTRRANVLVDAVELGPLIGKTVRIGDVRVEVTGETEPCGLMDKLHSGLRTALMPDCRGGVTGRILDDGVIHVGDAVAVEA